MVLLQLGSVTSPPVCRASGTDPLGRENQQAPRMQLQGFPNWPLRDANTKCCCYVKQMPLIARPSSFAVPQLEADAKCQRWAGSARWAGWAGQEITLRVPSAWRPVVPDSRCHSSEYHQPGSTQPPIAWNTHFSAPVEQIPLAHAGQDGWCWAGGCAASQAGQETSNTWLNRPPGEPRFSIPLCLSSLATHLKSVTASRPLAVCLSNDSPPRLDDTAQSVQCEVGGITQPQKDGSP